MPDRDAYHQAMDTILMESLLSLSSTQADRLRVRGTGASSFFSSRSGSVDGQNASASAEDSVSESASFTSFP